RRRRSRTGPAPPGWRRSTFGEGGEPLLRAHRSTALRILGKKLFERLLRVLAITHGFLGARDAEHRVGRLLAVGPSREQLALRGDRFLVVALAGVRHADPVLRVRREFAVRVGHEETL